MKKKFYDLIMTSDYLRNFRLIDIATIAIELYNLGILKEEYACVPELYNAVCGASAEYVSDTEPVPKPPRGHTTVSDR